MKPKVKVTKKTRAKTKVSTMTLWTRTPRGEEKSPLPSESKGKVATAPFLSPRSKRRVLGRVPFAVVK